MEQWDSPSQAVWSHVCPRRPNPSGGGGFKANPGPAQMSSFTLPPPLPFSAPPFPPAVTPSFLCSTKKILKYKQGKARSPSVLEKGGA